MQWFRNCKTVTKLMLGFGLITALLCVLGGEAIYNVQTLDRAASGMYEHHVLGLNFLKDAHLQLTTAGKSMRNAMLARTDADLEVRIHELRSNREMFLKDIADFQKCLVVDAMKEKTAALLEEYRINADAQDKVVDMLRAHQRDRAIGQIDVLNTLQRKREDLMAELINDQLALLKQSDAEIQTTARSAKITSAIVMLVAVGLALLLGRVTAQAITRPLEHMVRVAGQLASGDLDQRIDCSGGDETGQLAAAFSGMIATLRGLIAEASRIVEAARRGQLDHRGDESRFTGAFLDLIRSLNQAQDAFSSPLKEASEVLGRIAQRDLTARMTGNYQGDFAGIQNSVNAAADNLGAALVQVSEASGHVSSAAEQLAAASGEVSSGAQEQASSLEETAASLEQMTSTVKQNAENARQASQLAVGSREAAEKGGRVVEAAVVAMGEINQASKSIAEIITTIDEIAFQTNLLALNAAVEAARAGEQGRGFAVVAAEVRNLAQRSAAAAREIKGLIQDSVRKVENGSGLVNQSGQTLEEIVQSVKRVTAIVAEIAAASQEQAAGIEQVNRATMQMDQVMQANTAQTEEMSSTAQALSANAEQLQGMVGRFKLNGEKGTAVPARRAPATHQPAVKVKAGGLASLAHHTKRAEKADTEAFEEF